MKPVIGEDIVPEARKYIMANLEKHKVTQRVNARVKQFYADGVDYVDTVTGEEASMRGYDSVVLAMGYKSNNTLEEKLKDLAPQVIVIGEARQAPGNSMEATGDASTPPWPSERKPKRPPPPGRSFFGMESCCQSARARAFEAAASEQSETYSSSHRCCAAIKSSLACSASPCDTASTASVAALNMIWYSAE